MTFIQYRTFETLLSLNLQNEATLNCIIPVTSDTILVLTHKPQQYQYISLRSQKVLRKGKVPFTPSSWIKSQIGSSENAVMFWEKEEKIWRLNLKKDQWEVVEDKENDSGNGEYYTLDRQSRYILKALTTSQSRIKFRVLDWKTKKWTSTVELDKNFFHFKIVSNSPTLINVINFMVISTGDKYSTFYFAEFQLDSSTTVLKIVQRNHTNLNYNFIPLGGAYHHPYIYTVGNSSIKGSIILRYNTEENSTNRGKLNVSKKNSKQGFLRKYLGFSGSNMVVTVQESVNEKQKIVGVGIDDSLAKMKMDEIIPIFNLMENDEAVEQEWEEKVGEMKLSIDGFSYHSYSLKNEGLVRKCRQEGQQMDSCLRVRTLFQIPKKYCYSELCAELQLTQNLTEEVLQLL